MSESIKIEYLVRGALLKCSCGTHKRRLNLPLCHGLYVLGKPMINKNDCIPQAGPEDVMDGKNIMFFGACKSKTNKNGRVTYELIEDGKSRTVAGSKCIPQFDEKWLNCHESTLVGEELAVTTESYLICRYGGFIICETSGQEYEDKEIAEEKE